MRALAIHRPPAAANAPESAVTSPPAPRFAVTVPSPLRTNVTGPRLEATITPRAIPLERDEHAEIVLDLARRQEAVLHPLAGHPAHSGS